MPLKSALVIDDDPLFRIVAEEALLGMGAAEVQTAEDGAHGLKVLEASPKSFDLVLCDLQMPNLDGVSVIRELGQVGFEGALVIISGEDGDVIRTVRTMAQMIGVRVLGALKKPFVDADLRSLVDLMDRTHKVEPAAVLTRHGLKTALADGRIIPFYQPKFDLKSRSIAGVEVLARAIDPHGKPESPAPSLDAAERHGLMPELTMVMIEHVIADITRWQRAGLDMGVSINISPVMLGDLDLPDRLNTRFLAGGIDPKSVTLELTEDHLLDYGAQVLEVLSRLRIYGFRLSIDDFGTGATSIEQLRLYPFNELKIDQSFVRAARDDAFAMTTVETSTRLAAMLGMSVVAEGVETEAQLKLVSMAGAHIAQGFLISRPMPGADLPGWIGHFESEAIAAA